MMKFACGILLLASTSLTVGCVPSVHSPCVIVNQDLVIEVTPSGISIGNHHCPLPCHAEDLCQILGDPCRSEYLEGDLYLSCHDYKRYWQHGIEACSNGENGKISGINILFCYDSAYPGTIRIGGVSIKKDTPLSSLACLDPMLDHVVENRLWIYKIGKMRMNVNGGCPLIQGYELYIYYDGCEEKKSCAWHLVALMLVVGSIVGLVICRFWKIKPRNLQIAAGKDQTEVKRDNRES